MPLIRALLIALLALAATAGAAAGDPAVVSAPAIGAAPQVGVALLASPAEVAGAFAADVTLTWERSSATGYEEIADAHGPAYEPVLADLGRRLRVHAVVETADGADEAWSEPTAPVAAAAPARLRLGAAPGAPVRLARWTVTAGERVAVAGALGAAFADADARLVLEPTVPTRTPLEVPVAIDARGVVTAVVEPAVNAVVWLELDGPDVAPERIRLGVVGVRPRIALVLGARADGRDGSGHPLVRDLRILAGSVLAPGVAGVRLSWEGMLPGDRTGTAVCRSDERVVSAAGGALRGGCRTRGAWATARWRLVLDPGTGDPLAAPFLPARSAWTAPRVGVPVLPRSAS